MDDTLEQPTLTATTTEEAPALTASPEVSAPEATETPVETPEEEFDDTPALQSSEGKEEGEEQKGEESPQTFTYEYDLPEAMKTPDFDQAGFDEFQEFAKENKLPDAVYKHLLDKYFDNVQKMQSAMHEGLEKARTLQTREWNKQLRVDPEIGGERYAENIGYACRGLDAVGGLALDKVLREANVLSNPVVVKAFMKIGRSLGEATRVESTPQVKTSLDVVKSYFSPDKKG